MEARVPEKGYVSELNPLQKGEDRLRVRIVTRRGKVVDFVVQYEASINGQVYPVVRYDGSHGFGHQDLLDRWGQTIRKTAIPGNPSLAWRLTYGIGDIVDNFPRYRDEFTQREGLG